jgi:hypothetical protein
MWLYPNALLLLRLAGLGEIGWFSSAKKRRFKEWVRGDEMGLQVWEESVKSGDLGKTGELSSLSKGALQIRASISEFE